MAQVQGDDSLNEIPNLKLPQLLYVWEKNGATPQTGLEGIMAIVQKNDMAPFYADCCVKYGWVVNEELIASMREKNAKFIAEIAVKMEEAVVNAGDTEVVDLMVARAQHFTRIGAWAEAKKEYNDLLARPKIVSSKKIDAIMTKCRIALFTADFASMKDTIAEAKKLNETAGDWDRRNRLKVYEALYLLAIRDVKQATPLLQSCIATFTSVEICNYSEFMFYALLTGVLHLPRTKLKKEIILNPQVISVIKDIEHMPTLVSSFYNCEYRDFFRKLLDVNESIANDRYMGPHVGYIQREFRVLAYSQFLEAYRSVTMSSMAASFGMPLSLLDTDLSHFIAAGRMTAKIDKVGDVIETSRPDKKNAQYQETIKKGDALLNQIQKLVRVVKV